MELTHRARQLLQEQHAKLGSAWLESYDWSGFIKSIRHILGGGSVLLCVDMERTWFKQYVLTHLNAQRLRPLVPIVDGLLGYAPLLHDTQELPLISHLLDLTYQNYMFWYVGKEGVLSELVLSKDHFLWLLDGQGALLSPRDPMRDLKLLQLYQVFEGVLFESLLGKLALE
ncbi:HobA family DNA replication regulator [Helicobacter baculiformis]|uniref:HobA family DNA replication regulator n=1 Tax=Helicobacter baculiformis TaxID=427351 RepID=A0ABV7ZHD8_9HELI|nr:HobA family DNA replication regulator [Helicobacter baculiformis]